MKKKAILLAMLFGFALSGLSAITSQEIIPLSTKLYDNMDALYLLAGKGTPSTSRPWSVSEAALILERVERSTLRATAQKLFDEVVAEIEKQVRFSFVDGFQFDISADLNLEFYWHTNSTDFVTDRDWLYGFEERKPLFKLNFTFALTDFLYVFTDLQYGRNRFTDRDSPLSVGGATGVPIGSIIDAKTPTGQIITNSWAYSQTFLTNILYPTWDLDMQTPKRAVASVGGKQWNLNISRDRISWGNGHSGNFILDKHVDYHEFIRFTAFSNLFKYEWLNIFFETNPSTKEFDSADTEFRLFMLHRLEFRLFERATLVLSENIMYRNDVFSFRYLNPAFIFHNLNNAKIFNAIAHLEVDISLGRGINLYGQYVLDQAVAPNEPAGQPNAFGYLVGLEGGFDFTHGILTTALEYAYANPALYRRENVDFLMFRRYHGNVASGSAVGSFVSHIDYIGYQWGGDAQVIQLDAAYRHRAGWEMALSLIGVRQGEIDYYTPNNIVGNTHEAVPSGTTFTDRAIVRYRIDVPLTSRINFWSVLDYVNKWVGIKATATEPKHYLSPISDLQFTLGCSISL